MITGLENVGIETITMQSTANLQHSNIPTDMKESIFIALPKKSESTECGQHHTISLMSPIPKPLLRLILQGRRGSIKHEIAEKQCGCVEEKGTATSFTS